MSIKEPPTAVSVAAPAPTSAESPGQGAQVAVRRAQPVPQRGLRRIVGAGTTPRAAANDPPRPTT